MSEVLSYQSCLGGQRDAFQAALKGKPLEVSLEILVRNVLEGLGVDAKASFYLANPNSTELRAIHGISDEHAGCMEGFKIASDSLACGLAAHTGRPIITSDVLADPLWQASKSFVEKQDFRACWSFPVKSVSGRVVGALAIYLKAPGEPDSEVLSMIDEISKTAGMIVAHHEGAEARKRSERVQSGRVETALRDSVEKYRKLFDAMDEGFAVVELIYNQQGAPVDLIYRELNSALERQTKAQRYHLIGRFYSDVSPLEKVSHWLDVFDQVVQTGEPQTHEDYFEPLERWFEISAYPWGGNVVAFLFRDTTARKQAELALKESEANFRAIVETAGEGIVIADTDGMHTYVNRRMGEMLGYAQEEFIGRFSNDFAFNDDQPENIQIRRAPDRGDIVQGEFKFRCRDGSALWTLFNASPLYNAQGESIGILGMHTDITERKRAEEVLRASEERQAFLLKLNEEIRSIVDPLEVQCIAMQRLGKYLKLSGAFYYSAEQDQDGWYHIFETDHYLAEDMPSLIGRHSLATFGKEVFTDLEYGKEVMVTDIRDNPYINAEKAERYFALQILSLANVPILKTGLHVGGVCSLSRTPRVWSPDEIALIRNVAELTWAAVERGRAEAALRASEERQAFLLKLSDTVRSIVDPTEVQESVMKLLAEQLNVIRAAYFNMDDDQDGFVQASRYERNAIPLPAHMKLSDFGSEIARAYLDGQTIVVSDTETDERFTAQRAAYRTVGVRAWVGIPLVKDGRLVAVLGVNDSQPREWKTSELELLEEVAERTWSALERTRAEESLRRSEERYRTLYESIDEGFCVIETLYDEHGKCNDYRFLLVNPAFERHTDLQNPTGKCIREIAADLEEHWFETYDRVSSTGKSVRFQNQSAHSQRWYSVYAFRVGAPDQHRVGILVSDITTLKNAEQILRESESRSRQLLESVAQAFWETDADGFTKVDSPSWRAYTGQSIEEYLDSGWINAVHPEDRKVAGESWTHNISQRQSADSELRILSPDGTYRWSNVRAAPLYDVEGNLVKWVGMNIDITERKKATEKLAELNRTLEQQVEERTKVAENRAAALRKLAEELSNAEHRERKRLAYLLHDDLQQHLVGVRYLISDLPSGNSEHTELVKKVDARLKECLDISRNLTKELSPPILHQGSLPASIQWLANHFEELNSFQVDVIFPEEMPTIPEHLHVFLFYATRELIFNAFKYSGRKSVTVEIEYEDGHVTVLVEDKGTTFNPEKIERSLEQPETFGLFQISERLEALGGHLVLENSNTGGARIQMIVPRKDE